VTQDQRSSAVPAGRAPSWATREPVPGEPAGPALSRVTGNALRPVTRQDWRPPAPARRRTPTAAVRAPRPLADGPYPSTEGPGLARRLAWACDRSPSRVPHPVPPAWANPASPTVNPVPRTHASLSVSSLATVSARGPWPLPSQSRTKGQPGWSAPRQNRQRAGSSVLTSNWAQPVADHVVCTTACFGLTPRCREVKR
jgi:hypothetical protein